MGTNKGCDTQKDLMYESICAIRNIFIYALCVVVALDFILL